MLVVVGLAAVVFCAVLLVLLATRGPGAARFPVYGWVGLAALALFEALLFAHVAWVATFFTALVWTAYIVAADAAVFRLRGDSLLHHGRAFTAMAGLSVVAWLIFEAYNVHLLNWDYAGVPQSFPIFAVGAVWAFATVFPGIFETADLFHSTWAVGTRCRPRQFRAAPLWMALGALCLLLPLALPARWAAYLFALVWAGFILLLDPWLYRRGLPSLEGDLERGEPGRLWALLAAGAACGFFWEFWNFWAAARWVYIFPILHRYRIFAMPFPGFLGFPPFALECFLLYILLAHWLLPPAWRIPLSWLRGTRNQDPA